MAWQTIAYATLEVLLILVLGVVVAHIALTGRAEAIWLGAFGLALVADIIVSFLYWAIYWRARTRRRVQDLLREAGLDERSPHG